MDRDFKGVWIPKDIWLNKELTMLDKVILVEIDSLDNEKHCIASNEYFAEFCQCSERKVTDSIKKLLNMGLIEIINFDGRIRTIRSLLNNESSKNCDSESKNLRPININNNIVNELSKDNSLSSDSSEFQFGVSESTKPKKKTNLSEEQIAINMVLDYSDNEILRDKLIELVKMKKDMASKSRYRFYASTIEKYLSDLTSTFGNDDRTKIGAVELSLRYNGTTKVMIPNSTPNNKCVDNVQSEHKTDYTPALDENGNPIVF